MAVIYIPVICEEEYPLFRSIVVTPKFPIDDSAFLKLVDKEMKEAMNVGISALKMNIDFVGFREWFGTRRYATYSDLVNYAAVVAKSK